MRHCLRIAITAVALCLLTTGSASAYTEFGNRCTGNATEAGWTALGIANGEDPPFFSSAGPWELRGTRNAVITRWKVQLGSGLAPMPQQLVAFQYAGEEGAQNLGESAVETLVEGTNEFTARIPVPEYAHIGLRGPSGTLYCDAASQGILGVVEGDFPVGASRPYKSLFPKGVPAVAIAEPDMDGDGYGDETQDQCKSSPRFQGPCPNVALDGRVEALRRGAILIGVTTNVNTLVEVSGEVSWPVRPKRKQAAQRSKAAEKRIFSLAGGPQQVVAGVAAAYRLPLPRAVIRRLQRTPRNEHLEARVILDRPSSSLEGLPGSVSRELKVKLPGRERRSAGR